MGLKFVTLLVQPDLRTAQYEREVRDAAGNQCVRFQASEFIRSGNGRRHTAQASVVVASTEFYSTRVSSVLIYNVRFRVSEELTFRS
jgi:hypothetical protein